MVVRIKTRRGVPSGLQTLHPLDAPIFAQPHSLKKNYKEPILQSSNWRDMFDNEGNPLFDSTDDENSRYNDDK